MPLHSELLELAFELANSTKQAHLRRSISSSYYAFFHRLAYESATHFFPHPDDALIHAATTRALDHRTALIVCQSFAGLSVPRGPVKHFIETVAVPNELKQLSRTFVLLQGVRHLADYDVSVQFTSMNALEHCGDVSYAFMDLDKCRSDPAFRLFLACLLFANSWRV